MDDIMEISLESEDGVVDCQIEKQLDKEPMTYSVTTLYPHKVDGRNASKVYFNNMHFSADKKCLLFEDETEVHPKIKQLEEKISQAILAGRK